ncbi:MAG TPA: oligosaccharide flippase family protein [Puia sp.]|nr:oligosaccharide flippase family protein [Puia sp.]
MKKTSSLIIQHLIWRGLYFFSVLILNILISRFFAAEKSGQIFYIINNLSFVLLITGLSLESGAVYYIASEQVNSGQVARFCMLWTIIAAGLAIIIWWIFFRPGDFFLLTNPTKIMGASCLYVTGALLTTYFSALFYSQKQFAIPNKILLVTNALLILLMLIGHAADWMRHNFILIYFAIYFLQGFSIAALFFSNYGSGSFPGLPALPVLKKIFRYAMHALMANALYFLVNRMDYWLVERYCSQADLGNYIQASKLGQMLLILPSILSATLFPLLAEADPHQNKSRIIMVARVLLWINLTGCVLIAALGSYLIPMIFGLSFDKMYLLFVLLIPGILAFTANYPLATWFGAANRITINIICSVFALMLILLADLLFLPRYGVNVASVVSSLAYLGYFSISLFHFRKGSQLRLADLLLIRKKDLQWLYRQLRSRISLTFPEKTFIS